jgi:hypothetical protein
MGKIIALKIVVYIILIPVFILFGCKNPNKNISNVLDITCTPDLMPEFDISTGTFLDDNGKKQEIILEKTEKRRTVFKPCRQLIYRLIWKDSSGLELTNSMVKMMATGKRWTVQPEKQDEILTQFEYTERDFQKTKNHQLNKGLLGRIWINKQIEGIIENVEEIWMHPFRSNQYNFTEVAPFPMVKLPLSIGKTWADNLSLQDGWGDWCNSSGNMQYEVASNDTLQTKYGLIKNCWKVNSSAEFDFGKSSLEFWFNEELGFVKKIYKNYGNQTLLVELEEVNEINRCNGQI